MRRLLVVPIVGLFAACGPKLGDPVPPTSNQMQANTQLTTSVDQIAQLGKKPDNAFALYGTLSAVGPTAVDPSAKKSALWTGELGAQDLTPAGCASGSEATGYTYNNCSSGGTTINGSVKISGGKTDIDLQVKSSSQGANAKLSLVGSVTNDGSHLAGDLTYQIELDLGGLGGLTGGAGNIKTTVKYDLNYGQAPVCIKSGTLRVDYEAGGTTGVAQFEYTGCGTYTVRNG